MHGTDVHDRQENQAGHAATAGASGRAAVMPQRNRQVVSGRPRAQERLARYSCRRSPCHSRPERRREVDLDEGAVWRLCRRARADHGQGPAGDDCSSRRCRRARHRRDLQEFSLVPYLDIAQNIFLGREAGFSRFGLVDAAAMHAAARAIEAISGSTTTPDPMLPISAWLSSRWWKSPRRCHKTHACW